MYLATPQTPEEFRICMINIEQQPQRDKEISTRAMEENEKRT